MKKNIIIALLAILIGGFVQAQEVKWQTIENASKTENTTKLYFIDFYTNWCGWCKRMDRDTFSDSTVATILNKYYIPIKFNAEGASQFEWNSRTFTKGISVNGRPATHTFVTYVLGNKIGYPSFAIFNAEKRLLQVIPGYVKADEFAQILWYFASGSYTRLPYERYQQTFDKDIKPVMLKQLR